MKKPPFCRNIRFFPFPHARLRKTIVEESAVPNQQARFILVAEIPLDGEIAA
ncbi:MAG: hypothetical protein MI807_01765 [Verrucomicrobiales bacterium]|nr:hypothetical protein [Verrucomicrobiales bacterium]